MAEAEAKKSNINLVKRNRSDAIPVHLLNEREVVQQPNNDQRSDQRAAMARHDANY